MKNIELKPYAHASSFRRIAAVAWPPPRDPTIYGSVLVRAEPLQRWLDQKREETGEKLTITHAVARAVALVLAKHPDINGYVRGSRLVLRRDVDVFLQVAVENAERIGSSDLSGVMVRQADQKAIGTIAAELRAGATRIREGKDKDFQKTKSQADNIPGWIFRILVGLISFLQYRLNINPTFLGAPRDPFGSAMVTSLGMMGVGMAWAPFFPLGVAPLIVLVGAVEDTVVAQDGAPAVIKAFRLNGTMDHRVIDGVHAAKVSRELIRLLENPTLLDRVASE